MAIAGADDAYAAKSQESPLTQRTRGHEAEDRAADGNDNFILSTPRRRSGSRGRTGYRELREMAQWSGQPSIKGSTEAMRMALLTFSMAGLQYVEFCRTWALADDLLQVHLGD